MPLDPMIANPTPIKINDPMEQYGAYLKNAFLMDEIDKAREEREQNRFLGDSVREGGGDRKKVENALIGRGAGKSLLAYQKHNAELDAKYAEISEKGAQSKKHLADASKTGEETLSKRFENSRVLLDSVSPDPVIGAKQMEKWLLGQHKDPMIGKFFAEHGVTPEQSLEELNAAVKSGKFPDFLLANRSTLSNLAKMTYVPQDLGGHKTITAYRENTLGNPVGQVVSDKTVTKDPNAKGTVINIDNRTGSKYAEKLAELQATDDFNKGKRAEAAPLILDDIARGRDLVKRAYTGYFSGGAKTFNALVKGAGGNETTPGALQATQELEQILSSDMLKNIGTLRNEYDVKLGSVTEKEFTQLQSTIPKITDDPATIDAWLQRLDRTTRRAVQEYQKRLGDTRTNPVTAPAVRGLSVPPPPQLPGSDRPNPGFMDKRGRPVTEDAINDLLRGDPRDDHYFDSAAGVPGLAKKIRAARGGTSTQGSPFPGAGAAR